MPSATNHQGISHCLECGHPENIIKCLHQLTAKLMNVNRKYMHMDSKPEQYMV